MKLLWENEIGKDDVLFIYPESVEHCYRDCDSNLSLLQILFPQSSFSFITTRYAPVIPLPRLSISHVWQLVFLRCGSGGF
jgi:hypothetical protein